MALIKSKINSLAWLKSAIYISVVGGVMLSSKPVSAANFTFQQETSTTLALIVNEKVFVGGTSNLSYNGNNWTALFDIFQVQGVGTDTDYLLVVVDLLHKSAPHSGNNSSGGPLKLVLRLSSEDAINDKVISDSESNLSDHSADDIDDIAIDIASGKLEAIVSHPNFYKSDIDSWTLRVNANHITEPVPEPTTIVGTALALGWGGWLKRKNLIKQDKTKS